MVEALLLGTSGRLRQRKILITKEGRNLAPKQGPAKNFLITNDGRNLAPMQGAQALL